MTPQFPIAALHLLSALPGDAREEYLETLAANSSVRIERIVSRGHRSEPDFWYDQPRSEFVVLLAGQASLEIQGQGGIELVAGQAVLLPAHCRHRVSQTAADTETVWLAVHFDSEA
jgi:cupin 2 domain-containing protein